MSSTLSFVSVIDEIRTRYSMVALPPQAPDERRTAERFELSAETVLAEFRFDRGAVSGQLVDVSESGARILCSTCPPIGVLGELRLRLTDGRDVSVACTVRRAALDEELTEFAVEFAPMASEGA